jgi:ribonuclease P protein component
MLSYSFRCKNHIGISGSSANMNRLKTRAQFQAVLAGSTLARTAHFALHRTALDAMQSSEVAVQQQPLFPSQSVWMGAMVPKRWAKRAVTRNAIKRQIYNVSAQFEPLLDERAHLVRLRSAFDRVQFISASSTVLKESVRAELLQLFERATAGQSPARQ